MIKKAELLNWSAAVLTGTMDYQKRTDNFNLLLNSNSKLGLINFVFISHIKAKLFDASFQGTNSCTYNQKTCVSAMHYKQSLRHCVVLLQNNFYYETSKW